jgi:diguanylate cyclase (GGDEF)-like protein/putative nucleotidyltransferase with HDIG domain
MSSPRRKRLGFADRSAEERADRGVMARALMYAYAVGAALALASAVGALSHSMALAGVSAGVCLTATAVLMIGYDALPYWSFAALVALGTLLIEWAVLEGHTAYAVLLGLPASYSAYYLRKREAVAELALVVGGYSTAVLLSPGATVGEVAVPVVGLVALAALVGMQRANANRLVWRLSDAAATDPLTGLLNRRGFQDLFETELERARRSGQPLSLLVGDLDNFKALNDRYGHAAGDRALEQLALILQTAKRRIDMAARIGGEEFAVILPDSDRHAALILAERMRREVRETFVYEPHELTISIGVATFPLHGTEIGPLVARADEALYAAKALGRDRTVVFSDTLTTDVEDANGGRSPRRERHAATVLALADVIDARDGRTAAHSQAVGRYAAAIARELGLPDDTIEQVRFGGIVHDVGKIALSDEVLRKPGWLTAEEWHEMRRHPEVGARIVAGAQLSEVSDWVRAHHERPDGSGYPSGLAGDRIPLEARILAVADAYEAMVSDRVYRKALGEEAARAELRRCAGTQFDRLAVEAFMRVLDRPAETPEMRLVK